jgi:multiple sugar transport system permease protein
MASNIKGVSILRACILLPWILPEVVTGYTWQWILQGEYGIVTSNLIKLGIISSDFSFFENGAAAMFAVILANVWRGFPFIAILMFAKLKTLPNELVEAARIDGASPVQIFIRVTISWLMPIIQRAGILAFIYTFNAFSIIYAMTGGGPIGATETLSVAIQRIAFRDYNFGGASAFGVIILIITLIIYSGASRIKTEES